MRRSPGHVARLLLALTLLATLFTAHTKTPTALAAGPNTSFFLLTADNHIIALTDALPNQPATPVALSGVTAGETLVGIDMRPQNGLLYTLGVNAAADTGTLYRLDWQGVSQPVVATPIGTASQIAFVDGAGNPIDFPDPATVGYGFDINPTVDRVRVTTSSGLNFRANPITGAPVDGDNTGSTSGTVTGTNPDGAINGLPGGSTGVAAAAYTNNYSGAAATTLYTIDPTSDRLFIQNPPNAGTQTSGLALTLNGNPLDATAGR